MAPRRAWPAACALIGALAIGVWLAGAAWIDRDLVWQAASWRERPWTLFTAGLVHLSLAHLAANLLALSGLAVLGFAWRLPRAAVLALLLAWPISTLSLLLWPEIGRYQGLSGPNHAIALVCWSFGAIYGIAKPWSFVLFAGVGLKLLSEHAWSRPIAFDPDWGFSVVYAGHLAGAAAGLACGLTIAIASRWLPERSG